MTGTGVVSGGYGNAYSIILVLFILLAIIGCVCYTGGCC